MLPSTIAHFFERHVVKPFKEHLPTTAWVEEVTRQDEKHHRERIARQGQTDFDTPYHSLPAADKVLVYCYYYLQMHAASTCHVYKQALTFGLGQAPHTIFVDVGSGPLTLPIGLAWFQHQGSAKGEPAPRLGLNYIGIEHSERMTERAKHFLEHSGLFHAGTTFRFTRSFLPADSLCREIDALLPSSDGVKTDIVVNLCYVMASTSVSVQGLADTVGAVLRRYPSRHIWLVFQNPRQHGSNSKWEQFKGRFGQLRPVSSHEETIPYSNTTNRKATRIKLRHEVLVRDPVSAVVSLTRPPAPQVDGCPF
jgi:hypothetical protein